MKNFIICIKLISLVLSLCVFMSAVVSCAHESDVLDSGVNGEWYNEDEYPKIDTSKTDTSNESDATEGSNVISLDPFKGVEILVSGISPYCTVTINNQNCNSDVQNNVKYNLDKTKYANGDTVTITAQLSTLSYNSQNYILSSTTYTYSIKGQPEYLTSLKDVDLTKLKSELADYISAEKAKVVATSNENNYLFSLSNFDASESFTTFTSCDSTKLGNTYFSSLKSTKTSNFSLGRSPFNKISFIYEMDYSWIHHNKQGKTGTGTAWFNISACNLVRYPDGSIKWGNSSIGADDFNCEHSTQGLEACVTATVTVDSVNYNISKID